MRVDCRHRYGILLSDTRTSFSKRGGRLHPVRAGAVALPFAPITRIPDRQQQQDLLRLDEVFGSADLVDILLHQADGPRPPRRLPPTKEQGPRRTWGRAEVTSTVQFRPFPVTRLMVLSLGRLLLGNQATEQLTFESSDSSTRGYSGHVTRRRGWLCSLRGCEPPRPRTWHTAGVAGSWLG